MANGTWGDPNVYTKAETDAAIAQSAEIDYGDGYIKISNSILICWGIINIASIPANSFTEAHIVFPVGFSSYPALVAIPVSWTDPRELSVIVKAQFTNSGDLRIANDGANAYTNVKYNWIAIGRL